MPEREQQAEAGAQGTRRGRRRGSRRVRTRREAEGRHRRSPGRDRLRARGQRGGVREELRPERAASNYVQVGIDCLTRGVRLRREDLQRSAARPSRSMTSTGPTGMRDGYRSDCKVCNLAARRAKYIEDPRKHIDRVKRWQRANPERYRAKLQDYAGDRQEEALRPQESPEAEVRAHARGVRRAPRFAGRRVRHLRQARCRQRGSRPRDGSSARDPLLELQHRDRPARR